MEGSFRQEMSRVSKGLLNEVAGQFGAVIESYKFISDGTIINDVKCIPSGRKIKARVSGASIVDRAESYIIPVTDTWPGVNVPQPYDVVTIDGVTGWVDKSDWDNLNSRWKVTLKYREGI